MASITIHTGILTSPKHAPLSDGALRLWLHGLCWSKEHLTDGFIPTDMVPTLHPRARKLVGELLTSRVPGKSPLWTETEGGYRIHDYADWQETSDAVQNRRRKWRAAKRGKSVDSTADSTADSTVESREESSGESRKGSGSGVGRGSGRGLDDDTTAGAPRAVESSSSSSREPLGRYTVAAQEAHALWVAAMPASEPHDWSRLQEAGRRKIADFVRQCGSLDTVQRFIDRVAASDYLAGRKDLPPINLFTAIKLYDAIMAGSYDNRTDGQEAIYAAVLGGAS